MAHYYDVSLGEEMSKNDVTGDKLITKTSTKNYDEGFDRIWGKKTVCDHDWCSEGDPGLGDPMTLACSRCGKEKTVVPSGYSVDELERDNPYNQWRYEK